MTEYVTDTGLVVTDRRYRAFPRDYEPNANPVPVPPVSVGPNASEGFGNTNVMYPQGAVVPQAWSGWPVEWATPNWGSSVGMAEIMQRVSTVFFCLDLNASILAAMLPYRTQAGRVIDALSWMENPQPQVYNGWVEAFKQVFMSYMGGEAFLWATSRYADDTVRSWVMLNPTWVDVDWAGGVRRITLAGADISADVLHIRYASWPGDARGHGPLEACAGNLYGAQALERYAANLATRGGIPWGVLTAPGNLSAAQATENRDRFVEARLSSMGAPAVLSGGLTLSPFTINPKDMALLELQQWEASRVALLLGVPPFLAGLPSGGDPMTYSNVSSIFDFHWRAFLNTKVVAIMDAISNWALVRGQRVEVNRDEYVQGDLTERAAAYSVLFNMQDNDGRRAMNIDEIRARERLTGDNPADKKAPPPPQLVQPSAVEVAA